MIPLSSAEANTERQGNTAWCVKASHAQLCWHRLLLVGLPLNSGLLGQRLGRLFCPSMSTGERAGYLVQQTLFGERSHLDPKPIPSQTSLPPFLSAWCLASLSLNLHPQQFLGLIGVVWKRAVS